MSKQLIAPGLWQYPLTDEGLAEAIKDTEEYANETYKAVNRYKHTLHVAKNQRGYYGPMNSRRMCDDFRACEIVYTANAELEGQS